MASTNNGPAWTETGDMNSAASASSTYAQSQGSSMVPSTRPSSISEDDTPTSDEIKAENVLVPSRLCPSPNDIIADIVALNDGRAEAPLRHFDSFSGAIYDTAWLSMITKEEQGQSRNLFPECFEYLLSAQKKSGVWGSSSAQIDVILNSLAALLALATRQRSTLPQSPESSSLHVRIERGQAAVQAVLQNWAVQDSVHVGFEILVPSLLNQLSAWNIAFDFPGYSTLMQLHNKKLAKFKPATVYSTQSTTLLHSLEALVGLIDPDCVGHHCKEV